MTRTALFLKHRPLARTIAYDYHFPGSSDDDVRQEAEIGLWNATGTWDKERGSFKAHAGTVITSHMIDCLKKAQAFKRAILTGALREVTLQDGDRVAVVDTIGDTRSEPQRKLEGQEILHRMCVAEMSPIEREVLLSVVLGKTYEEICEETHRSYRSIEQAFQRAKRKVAA